MWGLLFSNMFSSVFPFYFTSLAGWWSFKLWCYRFTRAFLIPFSPWLNKQYGRYFQHKAPRRLIITPWTYRKQRWDSNRPAQSPRSQTNSSPLGWDETGWTSCQTISRKRVILPSQHGPRSAWTASSTLLILCQEDLCPWSRYRETINEMIWM